MKVFLYQTSLSGEMNGYFNIDTSSKNKEEVYAHNIKLYHDVFNIIEMDVPSEIAYGEGYSDKENE